MNPMSEKALEFCRRAPVIPVLTVRDADSAVETAHALTEGGLPVLEITLRTPQALAAMEAVGREIPQAIVAAGSVRSKKQLQEAKDAGAHFAVSPGATDELLSANILPLLPGAATASEMMRLDNLGFSFIKFFRAACGGIAALKSFAGPLPHLQFCPTGGITFAAAANYLALPNVACVGGSWLVEDGDSPVDIHMKAQAAAQMRPPMRDSNS